MITVHAQGVRLFSYLILVCGAETSVFPGVQCCASFFVLLFPSIVLVFFCLCISADWQCRSVRRWDPSSPHTLPLKGAGAMQGRGIYLPGLPFWRWWGGQVELTHCPIQNAYRPAELGLLVEWRVDLCISQFTGGLVHICSMKFSIHSVSKWHEKTYL